MYFPAPYYEVNVFGRWFPRKYGHLLADARTQTPITGFDITLKVPVQLEKDRWKYGTVKVTGFMLMHLAPNGVLTIKKGSHWDFGSWAFDSPAVIYASLWHDAICHLTNARVIPWRYRNIGDQFYQAKLAEKGTWLPRQLWHRAGVSLYSQLVARWKDKRIPA